MVFWLRCSRCKHPGTPSTVLLPPLPMGQKYLHCDNKECRVVIFTSLDIETEFEVAYSRIDSIGDSEVPIAVKVEMKNALAALLLEVKAGKDLPIEELKEAIEEMRKVKKSHFGL